MNKRIQIAAAMVAILVVSSALSWRLGTSPDGGGFLLVITLLTALCCALFLSSALLWAIVFAIKEKTLRTTVMILFYVLFLPIMLAGWSITQVTERERNTFPFSYSMHSRSRLVFLTLILYAFLYYGLYQFFF